jgi:hypothetical protein
LQKRAGVETPTTTNGPNTTAQTPSKNASHCDGIDDIGCFQVGYICNTRIYPKIEGPPTISDSY